MAYNPFTVEAWSEYAVGLVVLFVRIFYRCSLVGRNWDGDDWFAAVAVFFWTGELCMLQVIGEYGSITGISDEVALAMSEEEVRRTIIGSKCLLAGWCLYVTLIWCLKACMLFLYNRLTSNTQQQRLVKITAVACVLGYVSTIIVILTKCGPIERNWQVYPYVGDSCALNIPSYLALVVTNVSTDLMILYIPLPLLWTVQLPMRRKVLYGMWLCTGVFIIVATILRCVICLGDKSQINLGTIWSIRETFVGIIAVNIPVLTPLVTAVTSFLGQLTTRKSTRDAKPSYEDGASGSRDPRHGGNNNNNGPAHQLSVLEARAKQKRIRRGLGWTTIDNDSEEKMVAEGYGGPLDPHHHHPNEDAKGGRSTVSAGSVVSDIAEGIQVRSSYEVSRSS